jgi:hypothetical protein
MMESFNKFWVVWNPHGGKPTYRHLSFDDAKAEAERLAGASGLNHIFYVLECVGGCAPATPPIEWRVPLERSETF